MLSPSFSLLSFLDTPDVVARWQRSPRPPATHFRILSRVQCRFHSLESIDAKKRYLDHFGEVSAIMNNTASKSFLSKFRFDEAKNKPSVPVHLVILEIDELR